MDRFPSKNRELGIIAEFPEIYWLKWFWRPIRVRGQDHVQTGAAWLRPSIQGNWLGENVIVKPDTQA